MEIAKLAMAIIALALVAGAVFVVAQPTTSAQPADAGAYAKCGGIDGCKSTCACGCGGNPTNCGCGK